MCIARWVHECRAYRTKHCAYREFPEPGNFFAQKNSWDRICRKSCRTMIGCVVNSSYDIRVYRLLFVKFPKKFPRKIIHDHRTMDTTIVRWIRLSYDIYERRTKLFIAEKILNMFKIFSAMFWTSRYLTKAPEIARYIYETARSIVRHSRNHTKYLRSAYRVLSWVSFRMCDRGFSYHICCYQWSVHTCTIQCHIRPKVNWNMHTCSYLHRQLEH